jgi:chemosensory pili system protein ChpA (sensor histidine kinase/response regulator)
LPEGEEETSIDLSDELVDIFLEEGEELVNACDNIMHDWAESEYKNSTHTEELQRQLHTLKGGARMANLAPIGDLSHSLEEVILGVEKGTLEVSEQSAGAMTSAVDELASMLAQVRKDGKLRSANQLVERLERARRGESLDEVVAEPETVEGNQVEETAVVVEQQEQNTQQVEAESAEKPETEKAPARVDENAQRFADTAAPAAMTGSTEQIRVRADKLDSLVNNAGEVSIYHSRIQQQLSNFGGSLNEYEQTIERIREQVRQVTNETDAQIDSRVEKESDNPYENFDPLEMDRYSHMQQLARSLMESVNDLEDLRDTMNESIKDSETILHQQQRVSTDLQEGLMGTRMVHFEGVTSRLRRLVRQTAQQLNKKATITFTGTENEIDRTVQERMLAPLEHMLRNAVSHGIELPDVRIAKGKTVEGTIALTIGRDGSYIVMTLTDDGSGIDANIIRAKAIERGLMQPGEDKQDHEVMQYILHTGFSTAEQVTQISGRGVGMDVVSSEIKHLGGSLRIDSELGKGTAFTVRLPLTLAINQALMVKAQEDIFAIPLTAIEGVARLRGKDLTEQYASEKPSHNYAGEDYDIYYLPTLLRMGRVGDLNTEEQYPLLLIRVGDSRVAIHVDDLMGRREVVVKPVGRQVSTLPGVSGATILDDGRVALILEIGGLVQRDVVSLALAKSEEIEEAVVVEDVRLTVMVVDDSITIRKVSARFLERNNYIVVTAKDGMDAVAQLEDFKPDIMLLDIEMPRMDGYEVATHVRNTKRLRDLPIIMITSRTGDKHRERAMEIGVNRYLGKPFQEAQLLGEIHELMGTGE